MPVLNRSISPRVFACVVLFFILCAPARLAAQQDNPGYWADRLRAFQLYDANNFAEAQPLLEKLYEANKTDVQVLQRLGFVLLGNSKFVKDPAERAKMRERARTVLLRARELGDNSNLTQYSLDILNKPDNADIPFSNFQEADKAMREGEAAFAHGELDKAIEAYQRALKLDPRLYYAALFTGDSYFKKQDYAKANEWFARAIEINPDIETAYRYWGDSLMAQGRHDEARDKFIAGIVASPGDRSAYVGLSQWADGLKVRLAHPEIEVPTSVSEQDGKTTINLDMSALGGGKSDDGSLSWIAYGATRSVWAKEKFAKEFPQEKAYRHTLREEAEALHAVADLAREQAKSGKVKNLSPSLANLIKLDEAGLLEPYIFFVRVDRGVAQDYEAYRLAHRDKLQRYWAEFVVRDK
jgi:tetratricopeptide (TPR) repeat protein